jgi:nitrate reductase beta subunit
LVIAAGHAEPAHSLEALGTECPVGSGPFGEGSGAPVPIAVENFAMLRDRQMSDTVAAPVDKASRVNLLNWDGKGVPSGMFPAREGTPEGGDASTPDTSDDGATGPGGTGGLTGGADYR